MSSNDKKGTARGRANWRGRKAAQRSMPKTAATKCARCGSTSKLMRQHKDGNTENNAASNLEWLCSKCMGEVDAKAGRWGPGAAK